jgi:hypothetical protein
MMNDKWWWRSWLSPHQIKMYREYIMHVVAITVLYLTWLWGQSIIDFYFTRLIKPYPSECILLLIPQWRLYMWLNELFTFWEKRERKKNVASFNMHTLVHTDTNLHTREANFYKFIYMGNWCLLFLLPYQLIQIEFYIRGVLK